ncbi:tRNA preQ1(34) S-adenosylmethionine ribosyltransferase-isomerase QueA [Patescibacteria group bacterium]|nr:tRNA preQ1(34) S-adenosylmethionine ribosyltransferase-isomerase QueA [Patescibacteria group bacterium]
MPTPISHFDYELPPEFIAQRSVNPRDHSKLLIMDRATGAIEHRQFFNIIDELNAGDVLVFNRSKVFKARLIDGGVEVFVLRIADGEVECLLKPGKKFSVKGTVRIFGQSFVITAKANDGVVRLKTTMTAGEMLAFCNEFGQIPTPPYVKDASTSEKDYQTVYAKDVGSVAAPTAGFHFTDELLHKLRTKGVQIEYVLLHVGIGTFRPVQSETLEGHEMHSEWVSVSEGASTRIMTAKREGRRIVAVGTTTTRVLEGVASLHGGELVAYAGEVNMFIKPGYTFLMIDGLITNFHLPKSTLLVLVSAFVGRERVLAAYEEAKRLEYRFFSFGDAMFLR